VKPTNKLHPVGGGGVGVALSNLTNVRSNGKPELPKTNVLANPGFDIEIAAVQLGGFDPVPGTGKV
jgi:hypothetical protein